MAVRTPSLQERSGVHSYWGVFTNATGLPNASGNPLGAPHFSRLEAGDVAYVSSGGVYALCQSPGTSGNGDAVWVALGELAQVDRTGALNENITTLGSEVLLGGFVFNGGSSPGGLAPILFRAQAALNLAGAQGDADILLYDIGAPGATGAGTLRSTLSIATGEAGSVVVKEDTLSVVAAPGVNTDEIFDTERVYELRAIINNAQAGDSLDVTWGGLVMG